MVKLRLLIRYLKAIGHSRGYGILSPFAYKFVKDLRTIKKKGNKAESTIDYLTTKYGKRIIVIDATPAMEEINQLNEQTILVFRDIYSNRQSYKSWQNLCKHDKTTVTFDLCYLGIAFLQQGLSKKNYIVNI